MNPTQLFLEIIDEKHKQILEINLHRLISGEWDGERFKHEMRRYIERFNDDKHQANIKECAQRHTNVHRLSDYHDRLRKRPGYVEH